MPQLTVNGQVHDLAVDPQTPLLWVLRDHLALTGAHYGCGIGACGACTVHVDGTATRSCVATLASVAGKAITTIEGLSPNGDDAVQRAWRAERVPQCGYCQSGQIMSAAALLRSNSNPTDEQIDQAMAGNLCRCGTYNRIRRAIHTAAAMMRDESNR